MKYERKIVHKRGFYPVRWAEGGRPGQILSTMYYRYGIAFIDPNVPSALVISDGGSGAGAYSTGAYSTSIKVDRLESGPMIKIGE